MQWLRLRVVLLVLAATSMPPMMAQVATGSYTFGTYQTLGFDTINVGNLNTHFSIPILNKPGRGLPFYYSLSYDSSVWYPSNVSGSQVWTPVQDFGWRGDTEITTGYVSHNQVTENGRVRGSGDLWYTCPTTIYSGFVYHDPFGVSHSFPGIITTNTSLQVPACNPPASQPNGSELATDGSGYTLTVADYDQSQISSSTGKQISPPTAPSGGGTVVDTNGNEVSVSSAGVFTDTLGTQVLTVSGGAPDPKTFTYVDTQGNQETVTLNYSPYTVQTDFGCSGIGEYGPTEVYLVSSVVLPDGSAYTFQYESTPNGSGNVTGRIATVTLPQGGVISYTYSGGSNGIECADGSTAGLARSITATAGSAASTRTYARSVSTGTSQTTVTDGLDNTSTYDFVEASNQPSDTTAEYYETSRTIYQGAVTGIPLLSRQTCYDDDAQPCTMTQFSLPVTQIDTYNTLNGNEEDGSTSMFNSYGSQTEQESYDYGTDGSRGPLLSNETWSYGGDIVGLVTNDALYDGSGDQVADTSYTFDSTSVTATSGIPQHISVSGPRGNLDGITYHTGASTISITAQYNDTGDVTSTTAPTGTSTLGYDSTDTFVTSYAPPTPSSGVSLGSSYGYDANTGLELNSNDPNGAEFLYRYDSMLRRNQVNDPDGGEITYTYTPTEKTIDHYQSASVYGETDILYDAYGRKSRVEQSNGQAADPWYQRDICYDADGNLVFQSYRYQGAGFSASKVCSGAGDSYTYDALGRLSRVTHADGTYVSYSYTGRATEVTDEEGVTRISQVDGLGRTTAVCEISSSSMPDSGSPSSCGLDIGGTGFLTSYSYNLDTHTTTVTQGVQTRTFQTDWLGRPIKIVEPESGQTTYSYAYNSTGLQVTRIRSEANQSNPSVTTTTTYQYDSMERLIGISYSDGTPRKAFEYDTQFGWGSQTNVKGRLSGYITYTGAQYAPGSDFSYDAMGRVTATTACSPAQCGTGGTTLSYTYDWTGDLLSETDGASGNIVYTYSPAGEVTSITNDTYSLTGSGTTSLVSNVQNGPFGPTSWQLGNGLNGLRVYDSMGRTLYGWICKGSSQSYCSGGTTLYGFSVGWTGPYVYGSCDTVLNQCNSFGYDQFGRLDSKTFNSGGSPTNYTYTYDRWGNRWDQNAADGGLSPQLTFNVATNQIITSGYGYDAAGNMTSDGIHTYTYDADGNVTAVDGGGTSEYIYDAFNRKIEAQTGGATTDFTFDYAGRPIENDVEPGGFADLGRIYWGSTLLAYRAQDAETYFEHEDWTGTTRLRTDPQGSVAGSFISLPFGDGATSTLDEPNGGQEYTHFAMLDLASESDTDHAQFRQYANTSGLWMSPDPYSGTYDFSNPQSMNRYAYVQENPLSATDPSGMGCPPGRDGKPGWWCMGGGGDAAALEEEFFWEYMSGLGDGTYTLNDGDVYLNTGSYTPQDYYDQYGDPIIGEADSTSYDLGPLLFSFSGVPDMYIGGYGIGTLGLGVGNEAPNNPLPLNPLVQQQYRQYKQCMIENGTLNTLTDLDSEQWNSVVQGNGLPGTVDQVHTAAGSILGTIQECGQKYPLSVLAPNGPSYDSVYPLFPFWDF